MKPFKILILLSAFQFNLSLSAQDTFSILAFDSITREVGAAGASCVDLFNYPNFDDDFICELFPDTGAIATQASYISQNQANARNRMRLGDSPTQLMNWLQANDVGSTTTNNFTYRQYGAVRMGTVYPQTAAFTGTSCMNYKNHKIGPNYTIHGNILLGQQVLDSMEARFNREKGDLACKLMAALQGANMVGADTRCAGNGSSSLFAFVKVAQPTDPFGQPSFLLSLRTHANAGIEPIDSLQIMFDQVKSCALTSVGLQKKSVFSGFTIYPNPASKSLKVKIKGGELCHGEIYNVAGERVKQFDFRSETEVNTSEWGRGVFFIKVTINGILHTRKLILGD